jgi:hypothetical protein
VGLEALPLASVARLANAIDIHPHS